MRRRNGPLLESGSFAKYGDCWKQDKNVSPKIPRPFPVARCFVVELEALYRVGFDVISGVED